MENKLEIVPKQFRKDLQDIYLFEWPKHAFGYYTVHNYIKLCERDKEFEINNKLYCLNGDWADGTFFYRVIFSIFCLLYRNGKYWWMIN